MIEISANEFLGTSISQSSVKPPLLPVRDEGYLARVATDGLDVKSYDIKKGDRAGQKGHRLTVKWELINDEDIAWCKSKNRAPFITQSIMLNFNQDGTLARENTGLRALREALHQNEDGKPWTPLQMIGCPAKIMVNHRIDERNGEELDEVSRVSAA